MEKDNVDIIEAMGAIGREVRSVERDGKPARVIVATRVYPTSVEDAWDALTNRERIPRWFLPIEGELKLGGRYQFKGNAGGVITACEPPRHVAATWENMGQVSFIDVALAAVGKDKTRLTLEHTAFVPEALWDQFGPGGVGVGWDLGLTGLDMHLRDPRFDAATDGKAWGESDEGKRCMRVSSAAWCEASIRGGTDDAKARAAAVAVTKFYTGEGG